MVRAVCLLQPQSEKAGARDSGTSAQVKSSTIPEKNQTPEVVVDLSEGGEVSRDAESAAYTGQPTLSCKRGPGLSATSPVPRRRGPGKGHLPFSCLLEVYRRCQLLLRAVWLDGCKVGP